MLPIIVSCEHATCTVPEAFKEVFKTHMEEVTSSFGWDPGALNLAQAFAIKFRTQLTSCENTKLLLDCHLTEESPARWSKHSMKLTEMQRDKLHERQAVAHLQALRARINNELERHDTVLHLSVHTFEKELLDIPAEISLLFHEGRITESDIGSRWMHAIQSEAPSLSVTANDEFYSKKNKTIIEQLRTEYTTEQYVGIEIQVSQSFFLNGTPMKWDKLKTLLFQTLSSVLQS